MSGDFAQTNDLNARLETWVLSVLFFPSMFFLKKKKTKFALKQFEAQMPPGYGIIQAYATKPVQFPKKRTAIREHLI